MSPQTPPPRRLDDQNPWPGLDAFDELSRRYFNGREQEIDDLLARVEQSPVTVLFSKSGLGKTSLLRAGLMPRLRDRNFLPVYVRVDFQRNAPPPATQMRDALKTALEVGGVDAPPMGTDEGLWAYLHRAGLEFWNKRNFQVTPVFILDQFEEVFTLGAQHPQSMGRFRADLGDLAENRIPAELQQVHLQPAGSGPALALRSMNYKLLVSMREDFLPDLEGWRSAIPSLGKARMRLRPMTPAQALAAVHQTAPHLLDESLAQRIVEFVAAAQQTALQPVTEASDGKEELPSGRAAEVEPALLSLFCRGLNEKRRQQGKARFDDALLDTAKQGILTDYYQSCFEGMPESVSRFIATEMITEKGYRNSVAKDDATPAHISEEQLSSLINRRLLRVEERYGTLRIELTHDLLTRVVRDHRDRLRLEEERVAAERRAQSERDALEQRLQAERQAERERQLEEEARAGRRFKRLAMALGLALLVAMAAIAAALWQRSQLARAEGEARRQRDVATAERQVAVRERAVAVQQSELAQRRLKRITDSIGMKQAVLAGNQERIHAYLADPTVRSAIRFTAQSTPQGWKDGQGRPIYTFTLMPVPEAAARARQQVAVITYRMDHPTFQNSLLATGPERGFRASYSGWGCLTNVVVLVEYIDPDRSAEIAAFNMCESVQR